MRRLVFSMAAGAVAVFAVCMTRAFVPSPLATRTQIEATGANWIELKDGRLLEYFEFGAPRDNCKVSMVLLHGAMTTGHMWGDLLDEWARARGVRLICPTIAGWGLSASSTESSPSQWAQNDAQELLRSVTRNDEQLLLVGASVGSIYARELALALPRGKIAHLMLYVPFAPPHVPEHPDPLHGSDLAVFVGLHRFPRFGLTMQRFVLMPLMRMALPAEVQRSLHQWEGLWRTTPDITASCAELEKLQDIIPKITIVGASNDTAAPPSNVRELLRRLPRAQTITYEGGHDTSLKNVSIMQEHLQLMTEKFV